VAGAGEEAAGAGKGEEIQEEEVVVVIMMVCATVQKDWNSAQPWNRERWT